MHHEKISRKKAHIYNMMITVSLVGELYLVFFLLCVPFYYTCVSISLFYNIFCTIYFVQFSSHGEKMCTRSPLLYMCNIYLQVHLFKDIIGD